MGLEEKTSDYEDRSRSYISAEITQARDDLTSLADELGIKSLLGYLRRVYRKVNSVSQEFREVSSNRGKFQPFKGRLLAIVEYPYESNVHYSVSDGSWKVYQTEESKFAVLSASKMDEVYTNLSLAETEEQLLDLLKTNLPQEHLPGNQDRRRLFRQLAKKGFKSFQNQTA